MFGKHVFRSIKKEPVQPLMIIMIVSLCVAVMVLSIALPINIYKNEILNNRLDEWSPDLSIALRSSSNTRLVFENEIEEALGDKGMALGEFPLTGFSKLLDDGQRAQVDMGAYDLVKADSFFEFRYIEYGQITNNNLDSSAIISEWFSNKYGINLGDTVNVTVMGEDFSFVVEAIAKDTGILKCEDILVDISSVRRVLEENSPLIASLPADFEPYTVVHVKVNDGVGIEELKSELEMLESFADKSIDVVADVSKDDYITRILTITIVVPATLLIVVAVMMMISTFELLEKKREVDIALFKMAGADLAHLRNILYLEGLVYSLIGGAAGSLITIPAMHLLNITYGFKYSRMSFGIIELLICFGSAIIFTMASTYLHSKKQERKSRKSLLAKENISTSKSNSTKELLLLGVVLAFALLSLLLPAKNRFISSFPLLLSFVAFLYVVFQRVIGVFAVLIGKILIIKNKALGKLFIASRSCKNSYPLRHAGRIMVVLITMLTSLVFILSTTRKQLEAYTGFASFDYMGMYVDEETIELAKELDGVVATCESMIHRNILIEGELLTSGISLDGDVSQCFGGEILPKNLPKGNSLALASGVAKSLDLKVGDTVNCVIDDRPYELILTEIVKTRSDFAYYDPEYIEVSLDMFCILTDGTEETYEALSALFDERGADFMEKDDFFADTYEIVNPQITVIHAMLYVIILITVVGIFNVLADQRMARKREFEVLKQNGATEKEVVLIQAIEIIYLAVCAVLGAALCSILICRIMDMLCVSFGMTLYP